MAKSVVKQIDPLTPEQRSARMAKVRAKGNRSTELRVAGALIRHGIRGWKRNCGEITGRPDFYFPDSSLAIFVDGCFWHGCPKCQRNMPTNRAEFWADKIAANRDRDRRVVRELRKTGIRVMRIWEHSLNGREWLEKLKQLL